MTVLEKEFFIEQFRAVREDMGRQFHDVNDRLDLIDGRLDSHDEKLSAIMDSLTKYDAAIGSLFTIISDQQREIERIKERLGIDKAEH